MLSIVDNSTLRNRFPAAFANSNSNGKSAILGIGAFGHDASAALIDNKDGMAIFASAEERHSNIKHDWHFPVASIARCCKFAQAAGFSISEVAVNFRAEEFLTRSMFKRLDDATNSPTARRAIRQVLIKNFCSGDYFRLADQSIAADRIREALRYCSLDRDTLQSIVECITWYYNWSIKYQRVEATICREFASLPITFVNHHAAHAASAFYNSGFDEATVLVIDGSGEVDTTTVYRGDANGLTRESESLWPCSIGIFYLFITQHLGFSLGDEYKVMGMSAYGQPKYYDILRPMFDVTESATVVQNETPYQTLQNLAGLGHLAYQFTDRFHREVPARAAGTAFEQTHFDLAASAQRVVEEIGVCLAKKAMARTGLRNLCIAGGVGLNGLMNEAIRRHSGCDQIYIFPAAADDGTSIGAAQWVAAQNQPIAPKALKACYLGGSVNENAIRSVLDRMHLEWTRPDSIHESIAEAIAQGHVVARCDGRSEFGPRALGNRSILAHPGLANMKDTLNARVKHREEFRPFAPACLLERAHEYFELDGPSPFMLLIATATAKAKRTVPAVVHADGTARVQTITESDNPDFYATIKAFEKLTGLPLVVNTSFNVNGEAIVETALDAIESFGFMDIDYLAIGPYWISKKTNAHRFATESHDAYLAKRKNRHQQSNYGPLMQLDIGAFNEAFQCPDAAIQNFIDDIATEVPLRRAA